MSEALRPGTSLVLGGARSGKSAFGESLVAGSGLEPVYIATGEAHDREMVERIAAHRRRRGEVWRTVETPLDLDAAIAGEAGPSRALLVDCLTLWLSNLMMAGRDVAAAGAALAETLSNPAGPVVCVANEVGLGLVPETPEGRAFRDHAGRLNQAVAAAAHRVVFVAAGLPLTLKG